MSRRPSSAAATAGVDRWRGGWVAVQGSSPTDATVFAVGSVSELVDETRDCVTVAIDMPMALPITGRRDAEEQLRRRLGPAGRSVFMSPTRAAIDASSQSEATRVNRAMDGPGISAQAWGLAGSIRELRAVLPTTDALGRWFETHPETAFAEMAGRPLESKRSAVGVAQRLDLLRSRLPIDDLLRACPPKVPIDDVLDAAAAWWSSKRIADDMAVVIGERGPDDQGFERSIRF